MILLMFLLLKFGFITFASTTGGNAICMDLNIINDEEPRVVIADHSIFSDKNIIHFKNGVMEKYDLYYEFINKFAPEVSKTFSNFIEMLINDEIEDVDDYLDYPITFYCSPFFLDMSTHIIVLT